MRNGGCRAGQRLRLRRAFGAFDADGSGAISYAELQAAFRQSRIVVPDATSAECSRSGCRPLGRDRIRRVRSPRHPAAARPAGPREGHRDPTAGQGDVCGGEGLRRLRRGAAASSPPTIYPRSRDARDCRDDDDVARTLRAAAAAADGAIGRDEFRPRPHPAEGRNPHRNRRRRRRREPPLLARRARRRREHAAIERSGRGGGGGGGGGGRERAPRAGRTRVCPRRVSGARYALGRVSDPQRAGGARPTPPPHSLRACLFRYRLDRGVRRP